MITAIEAKPGQGKTVYCTYLIERYLRRGYKVVTNVRTRFPKATYASTWEDILKHIYEHCSDDATMSKGREGSLKIVLDELQIYLNSRNWEKLPLEVQLLLSQHRHYGVDIIGATQSTKRVDTIFRELVQVLYRLRRITVFSLFGHTFGWFALREYDADDIDKDKNEREPVGFPSVYYVDPPVFKSFNSWQKLDNHLDSEVEEIIRYKVCNAGARHRL